jgi:hypothetical protein
VINGQNVTVQKGVFRLNDFCYLKGAVACPFSGPANSGKPKWATFKALRQYRFRHKMMYKLKLFFDFLAMRKSKHSFSYVNLFIMNKKQKTTMLGAIFYA